MHIRPHLDYGDVIYHGQLQENTDLIESMQYHAALIVTNCWKSTSREKIYAELGWESLNDRRYYRRLVMYYKIKHNLTPEYLKPYIDKCHPGRTARFNQSFFLYCSIHWNNHGYLENWMWTRRNFSFWRVQDRGYCTNLYKIQHSNYPS